MQRKLLAHLTIVVTVAVGLAAGAAALADEDSAERLLQQRGLQRIGSYFVLPAEKKLAAGLEAVEPLKREIDACRKEKARHDKIAADIQNARDAAVAERRQTTMMLLRAQNEEQLAAMGVHLLELTDRITLLTRQLNSDSQGDELRRRIGDATEAYNEKLLDLRVLVEQARADYEKLASDQEVIAAIDELRDTTGRKVHLGPRRVFQRYEKQLAELEKAVRNDVIELDRRGEVFLIDVKLNGNLKETMVLDTGASFVSIPSSLATRLGIALTDADPTMTMSLADGRNVDAKLIQLKSVGVGRFTVENVDCVVMPADMADAPPLLGGSFLRNFVYRVNPDAQRLVLSRLESTDE